MIRPIRIALVGVHGPGVTADRAIPMPSDHVAQATGLPMQAQRVPADDIPGPQRRAD